jgi:hypothetical protein
MSSHDLYEDGFPHGTRDGYDRGCRGNACPAGIEHGLSCKRAYSLGAGDYRYSRLVAEGRTPAQIAAVLDERPHTHTAPPKPRIVIDDEDDTDTGLADEPEPEQEELIMPTPKTVARKRPSKDTLGEQLAAAKTTKAFAPGPSQSEVRVWAHANGIDVNPRGSLRADVVEAYRKAHSETPAAADETAPVLDATPQAAATPGEVWVDISPDMSKFDAAMAAVLNRDADGEPDLPESTEGWSWPGDREAMTIVATYEPDLAEQLAQLNAHLEHLRDERDHANDCLALILTKWAEEQDRAAAAIAERDAAQGAARLLREALAQAEEELQAARGLSAARQAEIVRLEQRPWWKRASA